MSLGTRHEAEVAPVLGVEADALVACVACGLCLPHCPTYRVSGLEIASPRGRIAAMRAVAFGDAPIDATFVRAMEECIQCRGCEAACPSSVPFGALMEGTRATLHRRRPVHRHLRRRFVEGIVYRVVLPRRRMLRAATWVLWALQRVRLVPSGVGLPPLHAASLRTPLDVRPAGEGDAVVFPGCVMDAWQRDVHRAAVRVMRALGATPMLPGAGADCCGALHLHAGRVEEARRLARRVIQSMPGDAPIVVDSAGCGATMKDYGRLVGTEDARAFAARVVDFAEWVATRDLPARTPTGRAVVVQDPCHLRHVQKVHDALRRTLATTYEIRETDDDGLCCGAGGAYSVLQPAYARAVRDRKVAAIRAAGGPAPLVVSANPGCMLHLRAAGLDVRHVAELLADVLCADDPGART